MSKSMDAGRLTISMVAETVQYVNKLKEMEKVTGKSLNRMIKDYDKVGAHAKKFGDKTTGLSNRLKNMSQTAALVTGPLGGISSRLSILSSVVSAGPLVGGVVALGATFAGLFKILSNGVSKIDQDIMQLDQLSATIKQTGYAAGITVNEMNAFAKVLAVDTLASLEDTRKAMGKLITFTSITGDVFFETTKIAEDMAAAGFGSLTDNVVQLAKAMSDPAKALGALTRNGVTFTEAQKELIVALQKENQLYKAQTLILKIVTDQLGEVGKSQALRTIAGQTDTLGLRWDELSKTLSETSHGPVLEFLKSLNEQILWLNKKLDHNYQFKLDSPTQARKEIESVIKGLDDAAAKSKIELEIKTKTDSLKKYQSEIGALTKSKEFRTWIDGQIGGSLIGYNKFRHSIHEITTAVMGTNDVINNNIDSYERLVIKTNNEIAALKAANGTIDRRIEKEKEIANTKKKAAADAAAADKLAKKAADLKASNKGLQSIGVDAAIPYFELLKKQQEFSDKLSTVGINVSASTLMGMTEDDINKLRAQYEVVYKSYVDIKERVAKYDEKLAKSKTDLNAGMSLSADLKGKDSSDIFKLEQDKNVKLLALTDAMNAAKFLKDTTALAELNAAKTLLDEDYAKKKAEIEERSAKTKTELDRTLYMNGLTAVQTGLGAISDLYDKSNKDHDKAQRNLFLATQAVAFAMNIIQTQQNMSQYPVTDPRYSMEIAAGITRGVTIAATAVGAFHGGTDSVPKTHDNQSFLLKAGERVVQPQANKDLTAFLKNGDSGSGISISAPLTIQGNVTDQRWFQGELVKHRQLIAASIRKAEKEKPNRRTN